ncbi:MAG: hypothetical protein ACMUEL_02985 [Flavobacteriales bacterium Tduv]
MASRTYFSQYKALVWTRKGSLQRIRSCACPASYGGLLLIICIEYLVLL